MTAPIRIQLSRKKGWRMPPNTVKVDRTTKWGNPYRIGDPGIYDAFAAKTCFRNHAVTLPVHELRGKNLACWCKPGAFCHADVLLELANQPDRAGLRTKTAATAGVSLAAPAIQT